MKQLHPGPAAARTLLYADYGVHFDDLPLIESMKLTHVAFGINSVSTADEHHRFDMIDSVEKSGPRFARALSAQGSVVCLHVWMAGSESFVKQAAKEAAQLAQACGASVIIPNPERPWWGTRKRSGGDNDLEWARLQEAARANHDKLGKLFVTTLREEGFIGRIWPAVFFWTPPSTHTMIEASDGLIAQMMSFQNSRKPQTLIDGMLPGVRQVQAWDALERWRQSQNLEWTLWGQQAIYHQALEGVPDEREVRAACAAYLGGAYGYSEANLGFWSLFWARRHAWAAKVIASYSPRLKPSAWRAAS